MQKIIKRLWHRNSECFRNMPYCLEGSQQRYLTGPVPVCIAKDVLIAIQKLLFATYIFSENFETFPLHYSPLLSYLNNSTFLDVNDRERMIKQKPLTWLQNIRFLSQIKLALDCLCSTARWSWMLSSEDGDMLKMEFNLMKATHLIF